MSVSWIGLRGGGADKVDQTSVYTYMYVYMYVCTCIFMCKRETLKRYTVVYVHNMYGLCAVKLSRLDETLFPSLYKIVPTGLYRGIVIQEREKLKPPMVRILCWSKKLFCSNINNPAQSKIIFLIFYFIILFHIIHIHIYIDVYLYIYIYTLCILNVDFFINQISEK